MLKEGVDVYVPLVDDNAIDAVIRKSNGSFVEIQIKASPSASLLKQRLNFSQLINNYKNFPC